MRMTCREPIDVTTSHVKVTRCTLTVSDRIPFRNTVPILTNDQYHVMDYSCRDVIRLEHSLQECNQARP